MPNISDGRTGFSVAFVCFLNVRGIFRTFYDDHVAVFDSATYKVMNGVFYHFKTNP